MAYKSVEESFEATSSLIGLLQPVLTIGQVVERGKKFGLEIIVDFYDFIALEKFQNEQRVKLKIEI